MKTTRLLITLLVMLVAANGLAQDAYREAVRDYVLSTSQYEKAKSFISDLSLMFDKNGTVDVDQLTKQFIDEQFDNEMIDAVLPKMTERGITEAELREVASLLSMPETRTLEAHQVEWMGGWIADFFNSILSMGKDKNEPWEEDMESCEDIDSCEEDYVSGNLMTLLGPPIQIREDIDPTYAARFKEVILESEFMKSIWDLDPIKEMIDEMADSRNEDNPDELKKQEDRKAYSEWMRTSVPNMMMNTAYGKLTFEDLDQAALLYSNDAYCKMEKLDKNDSHGNPSSNVYSKYLDWMEEQGATETDDPKAAMMFLRSLLNVGGVNPDDLNLENLIRDDVNLDDIKLDQ